MASRCSGARTFGPAPGSPALSVLDTIDADVIRPSVGNVFVAPPTEGLTDLLTNKVSHVSDVLHRCSDVPNLAVIFAGNHAVPLAPAEHHLILNAEAVAAGEQHDAVELGSEQDRVGRGFFAALVAIATMLWTMKAIVLSMTNEERTRPDILNARRRQRIARGSGSTVTQVNDLLQRFNQMRKLMKNAGKMKRKLKELQRLHR